MGAKTSGLFKIGAPSHKSKVRDSADSGNDFPGLDDAFGGIDDDYGANNASGGKPVEEKNLISTP